MASVSNVNGSSGLSSLYRSANIISGLASGLDTEGMIESLVQSYQNKIQTLNNKATKLQWKQDSYRNIISKMTGFASKYTSYTSSTNLLSASFFNNAVKVAALGKNGEKVTASGRTDSDVVLNGVSQLATAARYVTTAPGLKGDSGTKVTAGGFKSLEGETLDALDMDSNVVLSNITGSLSFVYGSKTVSISFDEVNDRLGLDENGKPRGDFSAADKTKALADLITEKLGDQKITLSNGESVSADTRIGVKVDEKSGNISFFDKAGAGNSIYISSASNSVKSSLLGNRDLDNKDNRVSDINVTNGTRLTKEVKAYEYLSGKSFNINVDGTTKTIQMPQIEKTNDGFTLRMPSTVKDKFGNISYVYDTSKLDSDKYTVTKPGDVKSVDDVADIAGAYTEMLQKSVKSAFGDKLKVNNTASDGGLKLEFEVKEGSNLLINTSVGETLGIGRTATNYLNTSDSLKDLMVGGLDGLQAAKNADGTIMRDKHGNELYDFRINDVLIGRYTKDSKLSDIISDVNANSEAGVKINYSKTTRQFTITSKETGSENRIELGDGLAQKIFGEPNKGGFADTYGANIADGETKKITFELPTTQISLNKVSKNMTMAEVAEELNDSIKNRGYTASYNKESGQIIVTDESGRKVDLKVSADGKELKPAAVSSYTPGQDAKFKVTVDGVEKELTRGSNSVDIDGLTINFNETFNYDEAARKYGTDAAENVTFKTNTDSDKIVDAVKSMITDYNDMMATIREAYARMPYQDSTGAFKSYEPLTEEQKSGMSQSEIENYEARAKQGILFGDNNLRTLYERMRDVFQPGGSDSALLSKIGISVSFSSADNSTSLTLDENKLRSALESNPDEVAGIFTRTAESGAASDGLMQGLKTQLDRYAGLTGATKGILVQQAGTPLNSLSLLDNQWQKQIDSLGAQIEKWQDKLESQVDRYTSMFSRLEVLINQMNSQSSTLAGLMGG